MATYKEIFGKQVKFLSSDPTNESEGQVWYNSTSGTFKSTVTSAAWRSIDPMVTVRSNMGSTSNTTRDASMGFGGETPPVVSNCEEFNGSGWTTGGSINTARRTIAGFGTQTAAVCAGGIIPTSSPQPQSLVEEYNGATWSEETNLPTGVPEAGGAGIVTAGLVMGGENNTASGLVDTTYEYDGSSWTVGGTLASAKNDVGAGGTQTAGLSFGGKTPPITTVTEEYNGASWTAGGAMISPTATADFAGYGGTQTSAFAAGGHPSASAKTELYDGTAWAASAAMGTTRYAGGGTGADNTAAISFGGNTGGPSITGISEEFNISTSVITAGAWASGGTVNTARQRSGGFGNAQTAAVVAGGATAPPASALDKSEEYDGTSWTEGNAINTARFNMTAFGVLTAGVLAGVGSPSTSYGGTTELYDGTTWTTGNPYATTASNYRSSCGPSTSGLLAGGVAPPPAEMTNAVEEFDGTNWTAGGTLPQYQSYSNMAGTQTAAINGAGQAGPAAPGPVTANSISLEYNGTGWTAAPTANLYSDTMKSYNGGSGTQTAALFVGGDTNVRTVQYDGTTFATAPSVAAARGETSAAGIAPSTAAIIFCGSPVPGVGNTTQEFTGETTATGYKTLTTS